MSKDRRFGGSRLSEPLDSYEMRAVMPANDDPVVAVVREERRQPG